MGANEWNSEGLFIAGGKWDDLSDHPSVPLSFSYPEFGLTVCSLFAVTRYTEFTCYQLANMNPG